MPGSDPPLCYTHGPGLGKVGAGKSTLPRIKHGFWRAPRRPLTTIDELIADLAERQARLSDYLDRCGPTLPLRNWVTLLRVHGQTASKLARLLRDKRAREKKAFDNMIEDAIVQALRELGEEWGICLVPDEEKGE
jgi:hypothetical protein